MSRNARRLQGTFLVVLTTEAGRNAIKIMLYYAIQPDAILAEEAREQGKPLPRPIVQRMSRAVALYNTYCFGYLKGALQAARIAHIFVGQLLARVRDNKLYAEMGHADLEAYCRERLQLGKTSLYNYLRVYDWVARNHPEWLNPGPDTVIPDLADLVDLIWVEKELEKPDLGTAARTGLETLKKKALTGTLKQKDLPAFRQRTRNTKADGRKEFLARMRQLRADGANLAGIPHEIVTGLDELIAILNNAMALPAIGLEDDKMAKKRKVA